MAVQRGFALLFSAFIAPLRFQNAGCLACLLVLCSPLVCGLLQPVNKLSSRVISLLAVVGTALFCPIGLHSAEALKVPRFSIEYMDRSVEPASDFYHFAAGNWIKNNPVPADKSRWSGFEELQERNWQLIREILESAAVD